MLPSLSYLIEKVNILRLLSIKFLHFFVYLSSAVFFIIIYYNSVYNVIFSKDQNNNYGFNSFPLELYAYLNNSQQSMSKQQIQKKSKPKLIGGYQLGKRIGSGTFATVKQGIHIKTNQKVAVKILRKKLIVDTRDKINLSRELRIIQKLRHPNVVQLLEILQTSNKIYLILENAEGGQLYDLIVKSQKNRLDEDVASLFFQQLLNTVEYLHSLGVTHRDLKPENILITKNNIIKLIDFGLSNLYQPKEQLSTACGSPCYAAPQMLNQKSYDPLKADLWSCGIVLYTMLVGYLPYQHQNTNELYKLVANEDYDLPNHLSQQARDLIKKLLLSSPDKRPSISQMRAHPFCSKRPQPIIKGLLPNEKIYPDLDIIQQIKDLGYSGFIKDLQNNVLNESTAAFYLLLYKKLKQNNIDCSAYYKKIMQKKEQFRSRSIIDKRYQQKNPQQLPSINKKTFQSHQNLFQFQSSQLIKEIRKRTQSSIKNRNSVRIKRIIT